MSLLKASRFPMATMQKKPKNGEQSKIKRYLCTAHRESPFSFLTLLVSVATMEKVFDLTLYASKAIAHFWSTKNKQHKRSADSSNRGSVVGGKQLDGFIDLLRDVCIMTGVPSSCIYDKNNHIPGFFRSSKDWDLIIVSPSGKLLALIELKSQVGSYNSSLKF